VSPIAEYGTLGPQSPDFRCPVTPSTPSATVPQNKVIRTNGEMQHPRGEEAARKSRFRSIFEGFQAREAHRGQGNSQKKVHAPCQMQSKRRERKREEQRAEEACRTHAVKRRTARLHASLLLDSLAWPLSLSSPFFFRGSVLVYLLQTSVGAVCPLGAVSLTFFLFCSPLLACPSPLFSFFCPRLFSALRLLLFSHALARLVLTVFVAR
jgi:hypothetical protein